MKKRLPLVLLLFFGPIGCTAIGFAGVHQYSAEPIEAWVVDAKTKQPIEGVVVVAHWVLEGGLMHWHQLGELMILETVTDQDGRFAFPAWGPKVAIKGVLTFLDPELLFFKPGYEYRRLANLMYLTKKPPVRKSFWNGKTIELKPFDGSLEAYKRHLYFLTGRLDFITEDCQWKKTPRMIMALQKQSDTLTVSGIVNDLYGVNYLPTNERKCGSVKEYFRRYPQ